MATVPASHLNFSSEYSIGYGSKVVARVSDELQISPEAGHASITLVCGSNGAGKTTLLRSLSGIIPTLRGSCQFNENKLGKYRETRICYLPENLDFLGYLTPYQILNRLGKITRPEFEALSQKIRLSPKEAIFEELSKGNRQKVRFLLSYHLIENHDLILLDEPFTGLDIDTREQALAMLTEVFKANAPRRLLICMHTERLPAGWCDSSLGIYNGQIMVGPSFTSVYEAQSYFKKQLAVESNT